MMKSWLVIPLVLIGLASRYSCAGVKRQENLFASNAVGTSWELFMNVTDAPDKLNCYQTSAQDIELSLAGNQSDCLDAASDWALLASGPGNPLKLKKFPSGSKICMRTRSGSATTGILRCSLWKLGTPNEPPEVPEVPEFCVSDLPGLQLHLDAQLSSSITTETGERVTQWVDQSSNAYTFTATGASRPTLVASGINSKQAIEFDGTNQLSELVTDDNFFPDSTAFYHVVVIEVDDVNIGNSFPGYMGTKSVVGETHGMRLGTATSASYTDFWFGDSSSVIGRVRFDVNYIEGAKIIFLWEHDALGSAVSNFSFTVNGVSETVLSAGAIGGGTVGNWIGSYGSGGSQMDGRIGELIIGHGVLSAEDKTNLNTYLNNRW